MYLISSLHFIIITSVIYDRWRWGGLESEDLHMKSHFGVTKERWVIVEKFRVVEKVIDVEEKEKPQNPKIQPREGNHPTTPPSANSYGLSVSEGMGPCTETSFVPCLCLVVCGVGVMYGEVVWL